MIVSNVRMLSEFRATEATRLRGSPVDKNSCYSDLRRYLINLYGGMFAGLVFLGSIAGCVGLATDITELAILLFVSLTSASVLFAYSQGA